MAPSALTKRYCSYWDDCNSWWGDEGYYVRYAVVAAVFAVIVLFLLFGYLHALRRIKRGQEPLAYHRWLVRRRGYPHHAPQNSYAYYAQQPQGPGGQHQQAYPMNGYPAGAPPPQQGQQGWAPPPPAYGQHNWDVPPTYAPPAGASKAAANQNVDDLSNRENGEGSAGVAPPQQAYQTPARNLPTQ